MFVRRTWRRLALASGLVAVALVGVLTTGAAVSAQRHVNWHRHKHDHNEGAVAHVLLLSVDGLHQSDLAWYVKQYPTSALASLVSQGVEFTAAHTPIPSDSFPGMVGQVTGGDPRATGVYYDDSYNHALLPPGTTSCAGATPGTEVTYFEALDSNPLALDAGQGLSGLP